MNVFTSSPLTRSLVVSADRVKKAWLCVSGRMWKHMRQYLNTFGKEMFGDEKCSTLRCGKDKLFPLLSQAFFGFSGSKHIVDWWDSSIVSYIKSARTAQHEPQASKSFLGRDLCLDTFYAFYVSFLLSRRSFLRQIKSSSSNSFPTTPFVAFMSHISHFLFAFADFVPATSEKICNFPLVVRHARICQCAEKKKEIFMWIRNERRDVFGGEK